MILQTAQQLYAQTEQMNSDQWYSLPESRREQLNEIRGEVSYLDAAKGIFKYTNPFYATWWVVKELLTTIWYLTYAAAIWAVKIGLGVLLGHFL